MRFQILLILLAASGLLHAQVLVGGKQFERAMAESGPKGEWVLYEKGAPQNDGTRRWLTKRVLVELAPGTQAASLAQVAGVTQSAARGKYAVVEFAGAADAAISGAASLRKAPGVISAEPMLAHQLFHRFVPNDPYFAYNAANPGYQWHLINTGQNGATTGSDVNVSSVWDTYKGTGIRVAIVDDGLEVSHPDLSPNVDLANSFDFNDNDGDPSPGPTDFHGTSCAGVAAAKGNNGIGGSGVAPEATLVGLRLIAAPTTDQQEADAFSFKTDLISAKSNSWGPYDSAFGYYGPGPLSAQALSDAATTGRGGKGTVFLWAAGNGNQSGDDSNYDGYANSIHAIAVSAMNDKGRSSFYSEPGANILVCAPSNGGKEGITTTDRTGALGYNEDGGTVQYPDFSNTDYTNTFGGTSSATPAVAGVVALMLQANPNLAARDVQEILVSSATQNDYYDSDWVTNGAGFHFNIKYGAGLVNAQQAVSLASTWTNLPARQSKSYTATSMNLAIPDFNATGVSKTFTVPMADNLRLEHITVHVKARHTYRGNLEWRLISPSGISIRLARARFNDNGSDIDWTFMTPHCWGERSVGDWKLQAIDQMVGDVGTLDDATITFYGTPTSSAQPLPVITSNWIVFGREGWAINQQITASNFATSFGAGMGTYPSNQLPSGLSLNPTTGWITGTPQVTGVYQGWQSATNTTGTTTDLAYFYILAATPALSTAVDQPTSLKIVPFGFGDPYSETTTTHDGVDAVQTAAVDDEEYSGMEFTVNGPARLAFQWKVSSEKNYDYLVLTVDGYVKDYITGEVDWKQSTTDVGPGPHNVDIYYIKDQATAKGQDAGWIDQVVITPTTTAPVITTDTLNAYQGVYFRQTIIASNAPSTYTADGLPAGLTLDAGTGLLYGSVSTPGTYQITVYATNSFGTTSKTITLQVGTVEQGLAEALDATTQTFASSGDLKWVPQWLYAHDGNDAARSGDITDLQHSQMTTQVTGPCKVVFYWGVSSEENYDFLRFYIDDVEKEAISGEVGWTRKGWLIPAGTHTLKWDYSKDEYTASGLDSGLVDQFGIYYDNDGDGVHSDLETWFGTSDSDARSFPTTVLSKSTNTTLQFPSVLNNDYLIQYSDDMQNWTSEIFTATGTSSTWTDLNAFKKTRQFYRVGIP
ncbi:S8 family serine peptidase [Prosthecobacter vanneervenii]|uniref:Subtilisin-like proprotein convertase family protein n=1 Tax=Prosthecobacter vanneervenii TaxID=48466 RepID=A0A7W7YFP5_9BACT|nr:S8 family serine peptidase [Prosthecobacter vanneervenii]MBB5035317.1 subtilisin-like proprotein convertase family protein [Prosthecobacter vanneervenii]